jgi:hypothetical protein
VIEEVYDRQRVFLPGFLPHELARLTFEVKGMKGIADLDMILQEGMAVVGVLFLQEFSLRAVAVPVRVMDQENGAPEGLEAVTKVDDLTGLLRFGQVSGDELVDRVRDYEIGRFRKGGGDPVVTLS